MGILLLRDRIPVAEVPARLPSGQRSSAALVIKSIVCMPSIIDGVDFSQLSDAERTRMRKAKIGFVFQKFNLLPTLDARSNIDVAIDIAGKNGDRDPAYLERILGL